MLLGWAAANAEIGEAIEATGLDLEGVDYVFTNNAHRAVSAAGFDFRFPDIPAERRDLAFAMGMYTAGGSGLLLKKQLAERGLTFVVLRRHERRRSLLDRLLRRPVERYWKIEEDHR